MGDSHCSSLSRRGPTGEESLAAGRSSAHGARIAKGAARWDAAVRRPVGERPGRRSSVGAVEPLHRVDHRRLLVVLRGGGWRRSRLGARPRRVVRPGRPGRTTCSRRQRRCGRRPGRCPRSRPAGSRRRGRTQPRGGHFGPRAPRKGGRSPAQPAGRRMLVTGGHAPACETLVTTNPWRS